VWEGEAAEADPYPYCRVEGPDSNEGQSGPSPGIPQSPEGMTPVWSGEILTALVRARAWAAEPIVQ
jgi:hypothetical protein